MGTWSWCTFQMRRIHRIFSQSSCQKRRRQRQWHTPWVDEVNRPLRFRSPTAGVDRGGCLKPDIIHTTDRPYSRTWGSSASMHPPSVCIACIPVTGCEVRYRFFGFCSVSSLDMEPSTFSILRPERASKGAGLGAPRPQARTQGVLGLTTVSGRPLSGCNQKHRSAAGQCLSAGAKRPKPARPRGTGRRSSSRAGTSDTAT